MADLDTFREQTRAWLETNCPAEMRTPMRSASSAGKFGKLIGEFQALQHRAAHLYGKIEIARAAALKAAELLDAGDAEAELMVSVAKAKAAAVAALADQEGVQMHGGIGMTDEHDIGLYMKRQAVLGQMFGDERFHRERVAELSGY